MAASSSLLVCQAVSPVDGSDALPCLELALVGRLLEWNPATHMTVMAVVAVVVVPGDQPCLCHCSTQAWA
jgi:hypothetical protein